MSPELTIFKLLGEALALGLLVGAERYRGREPGEKKSAGVRTFAIVCLLGAVCGLIGTVAFTAVTFAAVAALVLVGYWRSPADSLGTTTELAAMLVFWIGYLLNSHEAAAVSLGIVLTIFLASKRTLHNFVKDQISEAEFEATLKFLAVALVVYPILPNREFGPWGFFNPSQVWGFVILVSTISYAGYFLVRWLGERRGLMLSSLAGGIVSTTAVTLSLADRARQVPQASRLFGVVAVLANAVQGPRLLLLVWIVNRELALSLAGPLIGMALAGLVGSWLLSRRLKSQVDVEFPLQNPYSIRPALKFGLFFVAILLLVEAARFELGDRGILLASAIGGLGSTSAVALSVSELLSQGSLSPLVAAGSILAAITAGTLSKWALTLLNGTRQMAFWLGGGLLTMLATAFLVLYVQS
ncbi:MAG: MgtC/SapB family protein [bacterium]|nr:MgtC/SapB family protein [bacterium]